MGSCHGGDGTWLLSRALGPTVGEEAVYWCLGSALGPPFRWEVGLCRESRRQLSSTTGLGQGLVLCSSVIEYQSFLPSYF